MTFIEALKSGALDEIRGFPKTDLHNHFVLATESIYSAKQDMSFIPFPSP